MATITMRKMKDGTTHYYSDLTISGKRYKRFLGLSRQTAIRALQDLEYELRFPRQEEIAECIEYAEAVQLFGNHIELTGITNEQIRYVISRINSFRYYCFKLGIERIKAVTAEHSQTYLTNRIEGKIRNVYNYGIENRWKRPALSTINREIGFQKRFFRYCQDNGWIDRNPWALISRIKDKNGRGRRYGFSKEDLKQIFEGAGRFHDFYFLLLHTGMRPTDAFVLHSDAFIDNMLTLKQRKTGQWLLNIPVSELVIDRLKHRIGQGGLIFPELQSDRQRRNARKRVQSLFEPSFVRENHINLHTFRHTFARIMLNKGVPKEVLQTFLGHRSIRTTEMYANWVEQDELKKWV